jgi:hypothetical protein
MTAPDPDRPKTAGTTLGVTEILLLATGVLGVLNLFFGFVDTGGTSSGGGIGLYDFSLSTFALAPTMLFLGGLAALRAFLPGEGRAGAWPALITTAIVVTLILSAIQGGSAGTAGPLFLIFGCVQLATAWLAYLFDNGLLKAPGISAYEPPKEP